MTKNEPLDKNMIYIQNIGDYILQRFQLMMLLKNKVLILFIH